MYVMYRNGVKMGPMLQEFFREAKAKVVSNSKNKFTKPGAHFLAHPSMRKMKKNVAAKDRGIQPKICFRGRLSH